MAKIFRNGHEKFTILNVQSKYSFTNDEIPVDVTIVQSKEDFVLRYIPQLPDIGEGTKILLETKLKGDLMAEANVRVKDILDQNRYHMIIKRFTKTAEDIVKRYFPKLSDVNQHVLAMYLIHNTVGLGILEPLVADEQLEEIVINGSQEPIWVFHKKYGWCKSTIWLKDEDAINDYASMIARRVGRQINILNPLLDASLSDGDRVNATLYPISQFGSTMTIRKFSKNPWTVTRFIKNHTLTPEVAAFIWLAVQNELSLLVTGGTGSGKTSLLNAIAAFIPPNQRIISIEDTRELTLPSFLHWVPMLVREANSEGKGKVTMLDLMVNSLRQRPDRILVGEIRRKEEAQVLFEAMHTGHSVYSTLHADNTEQLVSRLINPPISVPESMLDAIGGVVVAFRHRRFNIRRVIEFSEIYNNSKYNVVYKWQPKTDTVSKVGKTPKIDSLLEMYAGLSQQEIVKEVSEKSKILKWMEYKRYFEVEEVGRVVSGYYKDPEGLLKLAESKSDFKSL